MATANTPRRNYRDQPPADSSAPSDRRQLGGVRVGLVLLAVGGCLVVLAWVGYSGYSVAETYGGLGGGWAELLGLLVAGAGLAVGAGLVAVARLLDRRTRARWLVVAGVALAFLVAAVGTHVGLLEHTAASARAEHACDDPVGRDLVSLARGLEPGPLVTQDGELTRGGDDGRCSVMVNVTPDADVAGEVARVAAVDGWTRIHDGWLSPDGVAMTYDTTREPGSMILVELKGHQGDSGHDPLTGQASSADRRPTLPYRHASTIHDRGLEPDGTSGRLVRVWWDPAGASGLRAGERFGHHQVC